MPREDKFCAVVEDVARVFFLSSRASAPARGPGSILRSPSMGHGVWIPAFAGMTGVCVVLGERVAKPGDAAAARHLEACRAK